jgi:hypothetical protein
MQGVRKNFSTEIFRVVRIIQRMPQPVYELSDMQARHIEGKFYNYEVVKVTVSPESQFQIDKIVRTRNKGDNKQHLIKRRGYDEIFNSWVDASDNKRI